MNYIKLLFVFCVITFILFFATPGITASFLTTEQDQGQIRVNRKEAQELINTNKNAQALTILEITGNLQQKIFTAQRDSVAMALNKDFIKNKNIRQKEISEKQAVIQDLKSGNEDIDRENFKMIRNTLFFFGSLIGLAVLVLLNRFRKLSRLKSQLITSESQLAETSQVIAGIDNNRSAAIKISESWEDAAKDVTHSATLLSKISSDKQNPLQRQVLQLQNGSQAGISVMNEIVASEEISEKLPVDLNQVIEDVINQSYNYTKNLYPEFNCTIIKDLEKILPKVDLVQADIRFVLFNLLTNAFEAVKDKRVNAPKGYEPKVTVSTRKLPRFVQIRVRDNGTGINEKNSEVVFESFYTSKTAARHSGLGLTESKRIITANYKGELFIESDFTTGTDFIIRFPILTLM